MNLRYIWGDISELMSAWMCGEGKVVAENSASPTVFGKSNAQNFQHLWTTTFVK